MTSLHVRVERLRPDHDLGGFDCGEPRYDEWLTRHALHADTGGAAAVYLLLEGSAREERVVGYYAISPTQIARSDAPGKLARGWPATVPGWRLGKLAVHVDLRAEPHDARWGRQLLRHALETIVAIADAGGAKVIVVDADNPGLVDFYERNGFTRSGTSLALYLKVSTARRALTGHPHPA